MDQTIQCLMRENYEYGIHLIVHRMGDKHSGEHLPFVVLEEAYLEKRNRLRNFKKTKAMKEKECTYPIFRALEKQGLRWNPETEEIETKRWRAKEFERYYFVDNVFGIFSHREVFDSTDDGLWNSGNYFRTEDEARKYVNEFKRMLQERTLDKEE